jgi:uncharacterized membrane protein required for colicin V production
MNLIDIVVAVLCVLFGVFGIVRGLVRQLFSIGGLVVGHLVGIRFYSAAASTLKLTFRYAEVVGYVVVFLAVFLSISLLGAFIEGRVRASKLSVVDRVGGMVAGLAKGVIVLPVDARVLRESKAAPLAISAGRWLQSAFPDRIAESFREKVRAAGKQPPGNTPRR